MSSNCVIRIYANTYDPNVNNWYAWSNRTLIWRSDRVDEYWTSSGTDYYGGMLYDVSLSCEIGKASTLKFTLGPENPYYSTFRRKLTLITVTEDSTNAAAEGQGENESRACLFRGPVQKISVDIYQQMTVEAESALVFLNDSLHVPSGKTNRKDGRGSLFSSLIQEHNLQMNSEPYKCFTVGTVDSFQGARDEQKEYNDTSYSDVMSFLNSNVMDKCTGYLHVRYNNNFSTAYLDLLETFGKTASQKIRFAINLEEIEREDNTDDIYTVLVPVGKDAKTLSGVDGTQTIKYRNMAGVWTNVEIRVNGKNIEIPEAIAKYGHIYKPVSFSEKSSAADILSEAKKYISNTYRADRFTVTIKAIDMHYLDSTVPSIKLGDKVTVYPNRNGSSDQIIAICSAIDYDLSHPENTEYTIGTGNESLSSSAGGGGGGSSKGGGSYGGAIDDCIGYIDGNKKIIDGEILEINTYITRINSEMTYINSAYISLADRVTITEDRYDSLYADLQYTYRWLIYNEDAISKVGQLYQEWRYFEGSKIMQDRDHIANFVGCWKELYDKDGNFLGYEFTEGGGLFIERNNVALGLYDEGNLTGGMIVEKLEDGTVTTSISGDIININANSDFQLTSRRARIMAESLIDENGNFTSSNIEVNPDNLTFGVYTYAIDSGGNKTKTLNAQIIVDKINNGTVTINASKIVMSGVGGQTVEAEINGKLNATELNATNINGAFAHEEMFNTIYGTITNLHVTRTLFIDAPYELYNILDSRHHVADAIIGIGDYDGSHPISVRGNNVIIPYKRLSESTGELSIPFSGAALVTGSWDGVNKYTVTGGSNTLTETVGTHFLYDVNQESFKVGTYYIDHETEQPISLSGTEVLFKLNTNGSRYNSYTNVQMETPAGVRIDGSPILKLDLSVTNDYVYIKNNGSPVAQATNTAYGQGVADERASVTTGFAYLYNKYYIYAYDTTQDTQHTQKVISNSGTVYDLVLTSNGASSTVAIMNEAKTDIIGKSIPVGSLYISGRNSVKLVASTVDGSPTTGKIIKSDTGSDEISVTARVTRMAYVSEGDHIHCYRIYGGADVGGSIIAALPETYTDNTAYTEGQDSVKLTHSGATITRSTNGSGSNSYVISGKVTSVASEEYDENSHKYAITFGIYGNTNTYLTGVNYSTNTTAYDRGKAAGASTVKLVAAAVSGSPTTGKISKSDKGADEITITARVTTSNYNSKNHWYDIFGGAAADGTIIAALPDTHTDTAAYNDGVANVGLAISGRDIVRVTDGTGELYYTISSRFDTSKSKYNSTGSSAHTYTVYCDAVAGTTVMQSASYTTGTEAYTAGLTDGRAETISIDSLSYDMATGSSAGQAQKIHVTAKRGSTVVAEKVFPISHQDSDWNSSNVKYVRIRRMNSAMTEFTGAYWMRIPVDASSIYEKGKTDGAAGVAAEAHKSSAIITNTIAAPSGGYDTVVHEGYHWVKKSNGQYERIGTSTTKWYSSTTLITSKGGSKKVWW